MYQHLSTMLFGAIECAANEQQERAICEKEADEWILVDYIGGCNPVQVETSPLENLLIEHPSMSVYTVYNVQSNVRENSGTANYESETFRGNTANQVGHHIHFYAATTASQTDSVVQASQLRHVQRGKEHDARHLVNRNSIRRQNLTRECLSRQVKHTSHVLQQPCQRQYNY